METLSLRETLPEKQSVKRGMATWARTLGNKKAKLVKRRRRREDMVGVREWRWLAKREEAKEQESHFRPD